VANNGAYTVTLNGPIDHAGAGEDLRSLGLAVVVSDGLATNSGTITVNVGDDAPAFTTAGPADARMSATAGTVAVGDLNVALGADNGSQARVALTMGVDANGRIVSTIYDASGTQVGTSLLRYQGNALRYTTGADGTLTAVDDLGNQIFTVTANAATGRYTLTMLRELDAANVTTTTFGQVSAGNGSTYNFSDGTNTFAVEVRGYTGASLTTPGTLSTVNTNASSFGVANNFLDGSERILFDFNTMPRAAWWARAPSTAPAATAAPTRPSR
jgi:hypothetical protein